MAEQCRVQAPGHRSDGRHCQIERSASAGLARPLCRDQVSAWRRCEQPGHLAAKRAFERVLSGRDAGCRGPDRASVSQSLDPYPGYRGLGMGAVQADARSRLLSVAPSQRRSGRQGARRLPGITEQSGRMGDQPGIGRNPLRRPAPGRLRRPGAAWRRDGVVAVEQPPALWGHDEYRGGAFGRRPAYPGVRLVADGKQEPAERAEGRQSGLRRRRIGRHRP